MARKANPALIGAFVVGAIALAVAGLIVFGGGKFWRQTQHLVAYFEGSLKGMAIGAPVTFNGIKVGSVTNVKVVVDDRDSSIRTPVYFEIDADRFESVSGSEIEFHKNVPKLRDLTARGLRAQLELQSLVTGQLEVALNFYPGSPLRLTGLSKDYPEMPTIPSSLDKLSRTLENLPVEPLIAEVRQTLNSINALASAPEIKTLLVSVNKAVTDFGVLVRRVDGAVPPLLASIDKTAETARTTMDTARATLADVQQLAARLGPVVEATLKDFQKLAVNTDARLGPMMAALQKAAVSAEATLGQTQRTAAVIDATLNDDSPLRYDLGNALKEIQAAARSLRALTDYLDQHPEAVVVGKRVNGGTR
jgi:paraquat-inducible protein B